MKYVIINFLLACLSITMGCTSSKKEIKQVVEHWMGKEIVFPSNLTMKIYGKDTLDYSLLNHKYKILHYVDTNGCHECQLKFYEWQRLQKTNRQFANRYCHCLCGIRQALSSC